MYTVHCMWFTYSYAAHTANWMALLLSNFIVILMIYFGRRCHTSFVMPTQFKFSDQCTSYSADTLFSSLSLSHTFSQLSHYYLCRTIGCCRCFYSYDINTHPPPPPPSNACKPRGRRWHAIINNTALTYNQLHIDQQHIISYYSHSLQLSPMNEPGRERERINSLFQQ